MGTMPHVDPSWRVESSKFNWLSRLLCVFGIHHWVWSSTLKAAIACAVCPKKTKRWDEYRQRMKDAMHRSLDP
jgi:hypothetical protein